MKPRLGKKRKMTTKKANSCSSNDHLIIKYIIKICIEETWVLRVVKGFLLLCLLRKAAEEAVGGCCADFLSLQRLVVLFIIFIFKVLSFELSCIHL